MGGSAVSGLDVVQVLGELLARPSVEGVLENALVYAARLLGPQVKGFAVIRRGQDRVAAVLDYPRSLIGLNLSGPWAAMRPRLLSDGSSELYESNSSELQKQLDAAGMREVPLSLVVPVIDRGRGVGALVLDCFGPGGISPGQQEDVARFAAAIGPLVGAMEARDDWQQTARHITAAVVEAVESQNFDSLGHAQQVTELSLKLGRDLGLTGRDLETLWFAATMHDLGKVHGEAEHALIGANFLHAVPYLSEARKAIRHHHERWDGQGEPDKLAGEDIPFASRIVAVANAYAHSGNLEQVQAESGLSLDPQVVEALARVLV